MNILITTSCIALFVVASQAAPQSLEEMVSKFSQGRRNSGGGSSSPTTNSNGDNLPTIQLSQRPSLVSSSNFGSIFGEEEEESGSGGGGGVVMGRRQRPSSNNYEESSSGGYGREIDTSSGFNEGSSSYNDRGGATNEYSNNNGGRRGSSSSGGSGSYNDNTNDYRGGASWETGSNSAGRQQSSNDRRPSPEQEQEEKGFISSLLGGKFTNEINTMPRDTKINMLDAIMTGDIGRMNARDKLNLVATFLGQESIVGQLTHHMNSDWGRVLMRYIAPSLITNNQGQQDPLYIRT